MQFFHSGGEQVRESDYTIQVSASGSLTQAIQDAMRYRYLSGAKPIIQLAAGSYTLEEAGYSFASAEITGTTLDLTMTSIQSVGGSAGAWSIVINVTEDVSGVSVGDILGLGGLTGGTNPTRLTGAVEITTVDTANKRLTFTLNSAETKSAPSGLVSGTVKVFKSQVTLPSAMDNCHLVFGGVALLGGTTLNSGEIVGNGNAFYISADGQISVGLTGTLYSPLSYFGGVALLVNYGGRAHIDASYVGNSTASGAGGIGLTVSDGAMCSFEAGAISGYTTNVQAKSSAHLAIEGTVVAHAALGAHATNMGTIDAAGATYTDCVTDRSPASYDTAGNRNALITNTTPET